MIERAIEKYLRRVLEEEYMPQKKSYTLVALIAILSIATLVYYEGNTGAAIVGNRHSCGGNIIGYDVPSYYLQQMGTYYECFLCPGNQLNPQPHAMCKQIPLRSMPPGAPRDLGY